jgi:UDP-N-acetylglucosamine--N-acetylmuramyl-(pentapeptide) pyrophosphoryl-undecaprenol N-acetylglucosamine transferase
MAAWRSTRIMRLIRPKVTIATGGYVSVPVVLASWLLRIPVILFLPDVVPGRAVRFLAPFCRRIAVSTESARRYLPERKTVVTGYPVRTVFFDATRSAGRNRFDLPADARVLCVFGGSQGSRSLNQALAMHLTYLLDRYYVIHICGEKLVREAEAAASDLSRSQLARYRVFPYLHGRDMADALEAADLAVCRSGASTLGELPATGTPSILVPLPESQVNQAENAAFLADAGAATIVPDTEISGRLAGEVERILGNSESLERMSKACRSLSQPEAAARIAALVDELAL